MGEKKMKECHKFLSVHCRCVRLEHTLASSNFNQYQTHLGKLLLTEILTVAIPLLISAHWWKYDWVFLISASEKWDWLVWVQDN